MLFERNVYSVNKDVRLLKYQEKPERFWQLYGVELSAVAQAMKNSAKKWSLPEDLQIK